MVDAVGPAASFTCRVGEIELSFLSRFLTAKIAFISLSLSIYQTEIIQTIFLSIYVPFYSSIFLSITVSFYLYAMCTFIC